MINLNKGSRFNLKKSDSGSGAGAGIERFCVGCKWGNIKQKKLFGFFGSKEEEIDLDPALTARIKAAAAAARF